MAELSTFLDREGVVRLKQWVDERVATKQDVLTEDSTLKDIEIDSIMGLCELIYDDVGKPGAYVQVGAQKLSQLLANGDDTIHPAFRISGAEKSILYIGKYQGIEDGSRIYSLPGVDPKVGINLDTYEAYCRNKGFGHHCITAAEWAFLALWCKKNGTQPKGNNNYGKDVTETAYQAIPVPGVQDGGKTARVLTGTGPLSWRHDGTLDGICDLNGNVWEWTAGIRLVKGELQVIPYNNAADPNVDTGAASAQWKAIKANATSWDDLFITPDGNGTTADSVKLDFVSSHWQWATAITSLSDSNRSATFAATTVTGLGATAMLYLQAMALIPEDGATVEDYNGDYFWANNGAAERCVFRGGDWLSGARAGVFALNFHYPRSAVHGTFGGHPAYYE